MAARVVGVVGAECSGKSQLSRALAGALPGAALVPEQLRDWVARRGRPPRADEQAAIMAVQQRAEAAAAGHEWVVSDAGALMTAVYSQLYFDDDSLLPEALAHHRTYALTIWCDIEIPWVAEPGQRDGPQFRQRGHELLGRALAGSGLPVLPVAGPLPDRLARSLVALGVPGAAESDQQLSGSGRTVWE